MQRPCDLEPQKRGSRYTGGTGEVHSLGGAKPTRPCDPGQLHPPASPESHSISAEKWNTGLDLWTAIPANELKTEMGKLKP